MTDYYISPTGLDTNTGLSTNSPLGTFPVAISKLLTGDALYLMDGTYLTTLSISNKNGTASQPITIKALNERKAFLKSTNNGKAFDMRYCSYLNIEGLRFEGGDFAGWDGAPFQVYKSDHLTLRRILGAKSNRVGYYQLFEISTSHDILVEENELYEFHVHGLSVFMSYNVTDRRNYVNARNYPDIYGNASGGGGAFTIYNSRANLLENNIGESAPLTGIVSVSGDTPDTSGDNNRYFGNIALNNKRGIRSIGRWGVVQKNLIFKDNLVVSDVPGYDNLAIGFNLENTQNAKVENTTVILNTPSQSAWNYFLNKSTGPQNTVSAAPTEPTSAYLTNSLVVSTKGTGFYTDNIDDWKYDYTNVFGGATPSWTPNDSHVTNSMQINPQLGNCKIWIPPTSPMKGAGLNGADIGANIIYRYENGVLTNIPLWNPVTGEFPHGAVIAGVNDVAGQSAFDVHLRLGTLPLPTIGSLDISSVPIGARIFIDGADQSKVTRSVIQKIPVGSHTLKLTLAGYQDYTTTFTINSGATTTLNPTLTPVSPTTCGTIQIGSMGDAVFVLQLRLHSLGLYRGLLDGIFGSYLDYAVRLYQNSKGLFVDGIVKPDTWISLGVTSCALSTCPVIKIGTSGNAVISLQTKLKQIGYYTGALDGIYGSSTIHAVILYKIDNGLEVDDVVGTYTWTSLGIMTC